MSTDQRDFRDDAQWAALWRRGRLLALLLGTFVGSLTAFSLWSRGSQPALVLVVSLVVFATPVLSYPVLMKGMRAQFMEDPEAR